MRHEKGYINCLDEHVHNIVTEHIAEEMGQQCGEEGYVWLNLP